MDKKVNALTKHVPKDAQVIISVMKELNVQDFEPRVINQLLDFTYRYVTCLLDDAKVFANHARKKTIDLDDVRLATEVVLDKAFTAPPPRHVVAKLSEQRNSMPLPPIKPHCGLRLPPDRYCLSGCNYKLRAAAHPKKMVKTVLESRSTIKAQVKGTGSGAGNKRSVLPAKAQVITVPKPVIKFTTATKVVPFDNRMLPTENVQVKMETDMDATNASAVGSISGSSIVNYKREREDDEFEMV